jgi:predicted RNA-binding Zn ribbon-like protein
MESVQDLRFIGGHVALDFVNTAEGRGGPGAGEALLTPADLRRWGQRYGLLAANASGEERAELRKAIKARELLYRLFLARARREAYSGDDLASLKEFVAGAHRAATLEQVGGELEWHWSPSALATVRHVAVNSAVELLAADSSHRLKQCPGDHCGWFFLDSTKRGNRRWCSMDECGQDAKTARRRARTRGAAA